MENRDLLDSLEQIQADYGELVEKVPLEEKLIRAHEAPALEPWEISDIVQQALNNLPEGLEEHVDSIFDVVYDAISVALDKTRR